MKFFTRILDNSILIFRSYILHERRNQWYSCQNACPHKMEMVLSRGMIDSTDDIPKIACPMHKKTFSLVDGSNLNSEDYSIDTYPVNVVDGEVFIGFLE
jgi:nitrite reductase (NADH) small subunit